MVLEVKIFVRKNNSCAREIVALHWEGSSDIAGEIRIRWRGYKVGISGNEGWRRGKR
jgi:hypothetical protein